MTVAFFDRLLAQPSRAARQSPHEPLKVVFSSRQSGVRSRSNAGNRRSGGRRPSMSPPRIGAQFGGSPAGCRGSKLSAFTKAGTSSFLPSPASPWLASRAAFAARGVDEAGGRCRRGSFADPRPPRARLGLDGRGKTPKRDRGRGVRCHCQRNSSVRTQTDSQFGRDLVLLIGNARLYPAALQDVIERPREQDVVDLGFARPGTRKSRRVSTSSSLKYRASPVSIRSGQMSSRPRMRRSAGSLRPSFRSPAAMTKAPSLITGRLWRLTRDACAMRCWSCSLPPRSLRQVKSVDLKAYDHRGRS